MVTDKGLAGYVDGKEIFNVEHAEWTQGRVGLQAYSGQMDFDDFIVYGPAGAEVTAAGKMPIAWGAVKVSY